MGAELSRLPGNLFYWRENGKYEIDFVYQDGLTVYGIEVKSGRKKGANGMSEFLNKHPKAIPVVITSEDFETFSAKPEVFLKVRASTG